MRRRKSVYRCITALPLLAAGLLCAAVPNPARTDETAASLWLEVDISQRVLYLYDGGELRRTFEVAVGEPGRPTPRGSFEIDRIIWDPAWVPPNTAWAAGKERKDPADPENPMEAVKLFFKHPDYYIHGTDALHTLGQAESHGCIRMAPEDVERLAELVQERGGEPRSEAWFVRVKARERPKREITLPDPVPIHIHD